jgi:HTH-type transcriptional regulator/antitoxin HigA
MTNTGIRIHPIRTEEDHELAVARIGVLINAAPGSAEGDELDVLATLVDAWETRHHAIDTPDPVDAIQFRMEQQGLNRKDLEPFIGSRARVSEILTRKRGLTLEMIRRIKTGLGISADLLIGTASAKKRGTKRTTTKKMVAALKLSTKRAKAPGSSGPRVAV